MTDSALYSLHTFLGRTALYCNTFVICNIPTWLDEVLLASGVLLAAETLTGCFSRAS
jgi:hypothetical protein